MIQETGTGEMRTERTTRAVARLVVAGKVAEVHVLQPGHPGLVLLVVLVFGPLHFVWCLLVIKSVLRVQMLLSFKLCSGN